ncbi:MAG TPA: cobalamin-dependent protein [Gaiellaceae bacterium]|nr:cobalamin-dependent protein [Gaiellaceae bacterium]
MDDELVGALADLREQEALALVQARLDAGDDPLRIFDDARRAMEIVGERFSASEYFIPELVYAGEILKEISAIVKPRLAKDADVSRIGKVIIGTVAGDIHDIGKDIVVFMLDVNGFEVLDLGVDVPAERFVETIKETSSPVVGLSGFLTLAFQSMKDTVAAIEEAGLRNDVKIMIGGGPIDEQVRSFTGADAFGRDAMAAVELAKGWIVAEGAVA